MLRRGFTRKKKRRIKALIITISIITSFIFILEVRLKPIVESVSEIQAKSLVTQIINSSVEEILLETGITCEDLESVSCSEDKKVTAISSDVIMTNKLKNAVLLRIQENISNICSRRVDVPLGTIIGGELLNGQGPCVPVYVSLSGNVTGDFDSTFESGGLNQTVHKLSMNISVDVNILMPVGSSSANVTGSVLIGETVIVGEVPSGMFFSDGQKT